MDIDVPQLSRRAALGLIGAAGAIALTPGHAMADPAPTGPDVTLVDNGTTVTLANGIVSAVIDKATSRTTSLRLIASTLGNESFNLLGGTRGAGYTTFNGSASSGSFDNKGVTGGVFSVPINTPDRIGIAVVVNDPARLPFVVETHIALERGAPGLHYSMVYRYPTEMPDGLRIGQLRYAFATEDPSFTWFVVDDARGVQQRPTIAETQAWKTVQDATHILPDGRMYSKYQNISDLEGDNHVFMVSNGNVGLALIQPNKEAFCGGPTKQELTTHDYHRGEILLWHPFTSHYGTAPLMPPKGWAKIYGPFFVHVTESAVSADPAARVADMWTRSKARAQQEIQAWPYRWVPDPLYAATTRVRVRGQLVITPHRSAKDAWVILSKPGEDWQHTNQDYVYYVRTDAQGRFELDGVRPGDYTLTAFVDGVLGEFSRPGVHVEAGRDTRLGPLHWRQEDHGRVLWQIGTPNRSAQEFHVHGGPDGFRKHLAFLEYPYDFPNDVDFRVGVDDIATKWNYFQPSIRTPGSELQLAYRGTVRDTTPTTWKIRFPSSGYRRGTATLDIALSSSVFGTLFVGLNGTQLATFDPIPGVAGDAALYRQAIRGIYRQLMPITFPATSLIRGENVLTLSPTRPAQAPTPDNWMQPMAGIMYDTLRLSVDERR